jgi:anti-sigma factor RsiW
MSEHEALLCAYVDGELDSEATRDAERLIASDPRLAHMVEQYRQTSALLRAACGEQFYATGPGKITVPTHFRGRPTRRQLGIGAAAAMAAAVAGFAAGAFWQSPKEAGLLDEIAEYHKVFSRETTHLVEVPPARTADLTNWLGDRIGRHIIVPDLSALGLRFEGGRMLVAGGEPVAQLIYSRNLGLPIAVCLARPAGRPHGIDFVKREGLHLATWTDMDSTYVIVGDVDTEVLREIADSVALQLRTANT